jgi:CPA1 family monovalent cation:H+ antiporter
VALFHQLGAPRRLTFIVEAESLLNDATAIAFFLAALAIATGTSGNGALLGVGAHFVTSLLGGAAIGIGLGTFVALVIARLDDPMIQITLTVIAAYGSFALAEELSASGVLATVAAGLMCGQDVVRRGLSATTRIAVKTFWEYVAFALNSIVFLLIGFEVRFGTLIADWRVVGAAFLAVLVARALMVGLVTLAVHPTRERMPWRWSLVLTWGGLRGALSMVLALGVPAALRERSLLITMTFGVVILSILGEGLTMPALLRRLNLAGGLGPERAFTVARERFRMARAALEELDYLSEAGLLPESVERAFRSRYIQRFSHTEGELRSAITALEAASPSSVGAEAGVEPVPGGLAPRPMPSVPASGGATASLRAESSAIVRRLERSLLDVERDRLNDARHARTISQDDYARLLADIDERRDALDQAPPATEPVDQ